MSVDMAPEWRDAYDRALDQDTDVCMDATRYLDNSAG